MKHAQITFSIIAVVVAVIGLFALFAGLDGANSAPQEAAVSAMVLAFVIPFYVIARCVEMITSGRG
ncbi:hypothetical protein [Enhygromyxa salina]|uniref:Uncharacterized protein n=1 Tax=Enhygromyxa salina TaxID=215803 RepID=A0A2S9YAD0_9BACT|nr:hypothetical protein [Enhygromyxa salina]PRQ02059.1 hypothetical protein ENSA7_56320 [Enhygromyxa salina]